MRARRWALLAALAGLMAATGLALPRIASAYCVERAGRQLDRVAANPASYDAAERGLLQALEWHPGNAQAYRLLARLAEKRGDARASAEAWARFASLRPADPQGYWQLAVACEALDPSALPAVTGQVCGTDALSRPEALVGLWRAAGQSAASFVRAGEYYRQQAEWEAALASYRKALLFDPKPAQAWRGLGDVYRALGDEETAWKAYSEMLSLNADPGLLAEAHARRGQMLADSERWSEASTEMAQAAALAPDQALYHLYHGWYLKQAGAPPDLVRGELERSAQLDPASPWPYVHLASLDFALQHYSAALDHARRAVELGQDVAWAWVWQGKALGAVGRLAEALESLRKAVELAPDMPAAHAELGQVLMQTSQSGGAISEFERATELEPESVAYALSLADAYRADGQLERAVEVYRRVLDLDPKNRLAQQALIELTP